MTVFVLRISENTRNLVLIKLQKIITTQKGHISRINYNEKYFHFIGKFLGTAKSSFKTAFLT